jgi:mxaK protein
MTTVLPSARPMRSWIGRLYGFGRRIATGVLLCLVITFAVAAIAAGTLWAVHAARNRTIAALTGGHDIVIPSDAAPGLLFARAYFLLTHDRLDEAQPLVGALDNRADTRQRAALHYDMGNARLKLAFDRIERGDFDAAGALVGLAREDYREAIRLDPDGWNARFNFDVASRLVREYPSFGLSRDDERRRGPRPLWTELPNIPRGAP